MSKEIEMIQEREKQAKAALLNESRQLQTKYKQYVGPLQESFKRRGKVVNEMALGVVLNALKNFDHVLAGMNEATKAINVGSFIQYGYDLITAVYPNLVLNEMASVQPLYNRTGEIWFYSLLYQDAKGTTGANTAGISATTGVRPDKYYSSEMIPVAVTGAVDGTNKTFTGTLELPIRLDGADPIIITDTVETFKLNAAQTALVGSAGGTGTINIGTGAFSVTFNTAPTTGSTVLALGRVKFEDTPSKIGRTKLSLTSDSITAEKHALITDYTLDAEYDISRNFNMNMSDELIKGTAALLRAEIDQLGMNDIKMTAMRPDLSASASNVWSGSIPTGVSQLDHFRTLLTMFKKQSNAIFSATRQVHGNIVVAGVDVCTVLEILPEFRPNPAVGEAQNSGPYITGTIGGMTIIKNPDYGATEYVVGNKGVGTFNTGYILAPYRGLMVTPPVSSPDNPFQITRGMYLEAGRKVVNGKFYSYGKISNVSF